MADPRTTIEAGSLGACEQDRRQDGYAALAVVGLIAAYAVDLYKLLPDVTGYLLGKPQAWSDAATQFGEYLAAGLLLLCVVRLQRGIGHLRSVVLVPCILQFYLAIVLTLALLLNHDQISFMYYAQYMGGNFLLFFLALLFCSSNRRIKLVLLIWVFAAVVHASVSLWFTYQGYNYSSARRALVPSIGIRTGYFCAVAILALFVAKKSMRVPALLTCGLLAGGVVTSGSKGALLLVLLVPLATQFMRLPRGGFRAKADSLTWIVFIPLTLLVFLVVILSQNSHPGFIKDAVNWTSYRNAFFFRIQDVAKWVNAASAHWVLGNGLAFPYDAADSTRTHSTSLALFCQAGVTALLAYWLFVAWVVAAGIRAMKRMHARWQATGDESLLAVLLAIVLLLAAKAEITGTVSGNRELWFFCGVLLSAISRRIGPNG